MRATSVPLIIAGLLILPPPCLGAEVEAHESCSGLQNETSTLCALHVLAQAGNVHAQFHLGVMYAKARRVERDDFEAVRWFHRAAEQGFADAQVNLATMYREGRGVRQDDQQALLWYRRAMEQGSTEAAVGVGDMLLLGLGVSKDAVEAAHLYRLAAERGQPLAQAKLGVLYARGQGVHRDFILAYKWLTLAGATRVRSEVVQRMSREEIQKAEGLVTDWKPPSRLTVQPDGVVATIRCD